MATLENGSPAPDFTLTGLNGETIDLSQHRGTPVLLNFFKSTCPWCQVEMPRLAEMYNRHTDLNVRVLGVVVGKDDNVTAQNFAQDKQLQFPIAVDTNKQVREEYLLQRVPTIVLIDADGAIARVYEGSTEQLSGIVEQTMLAAAGKDSLPDYYLVGNG